MARSMAKEARLTRVLRCLHAPHAVEILRGLFVAGEEADEDCMLISLSDSGRGMRGRDMVEDFWRPGQYCTGD